MDDLSVICFLSFKTFPNPDSHVVLLSLSTEGWFLSLAARRTCGSEDTCLCCTVTLPGIVFSSPLTQSFVTLFSKLISEYNLSLKLYNARIMRAPMYSATVWCAVPQSAFAMEKETIDMSNFVSFYHGLKSRLWRSGRVLGVRIRSGIQSVCLLSTPSSVSNVE